MPHAENKQNISIFCMGANMLSQHKNKNYRRLVEYGDFHSSRAENRQNLSISRRGTNMLSQHDKTTADLLSLVNFMLHAENRQNLPIFRTGTDMLENTTL